MRKIFLAGGSGMAGSAILKCGLENFSDFKIRASYHDTPPVIEDGRIEYVRGDLRQSGDCRVMSKDCDCAIMAASYAGGAGFMKSFPWEHMRENLLMNMRMLEAFKTEGVRRVIFISSATVYQESEGRVKEDDLDLNEPPSEAYFGYAWAMRFIEKLCGMLHSKFGTEVIIVRASNIFGPYAKFDPKTSNFIPAIIRKAVDRMDPFEVWGSPAVTRDVIYSEDFARAVCTLAADTKIKFGVFNVGSGEKTTVGDVVAWALKSAGHKPSSVQYGRDKPMTVRFRALDCKKIKKVTGWAPRHTIEDGIRKTTEWWIKNKDTWAR